MSTLPDPVAVIAVAMMRHDTSVPSRSTAERARDAVDDLRAAGWVLAPRDDLADLYDVLDSRLYPSSSAMIGEWLAEGTG